MNGSIRTYQFFKRTATGLFLGLVLLKTWARSGDSRVSGSAHEYSTSTLGVFQSGSVSDVLDGNSETLSGRPTLVFESGGGDGPETWPALEPFAKNWGAIFVYKRAGYDNSRQGTFPRTGRQIATELHEHLKRIGLKPPYILVGQSIGGLYVRVFQRMFPTEVTGMVLIDPYEDFSSACLKLRADFFRRTGAYPCAKEMCLLPHDAPQPFKSELENLGETERELAKLPLPKTIPVVYLWANQPLPKGMDRNFWNDFMKILRAKARDTSTSINATFREVNSGHYIHQEHSDIVAAAIDGVMKAATQ